MVKCENRLWNWMQKYSTKLLKTESWNLKMNNDGAWFTISRSLVYVLLIHYYTSLFQHYLTMLLITVQIHDMNVGDLGLQVVNLNQTTMLDDQQSIRK